MHRDDASGYLGSNDAFYSQWTRDNYKTSNVIASEALRSLSSSAQKKIKNLQHYTFGGMTNIAATEAMNNSSEWGVTSGREALTGFGQSQTFSNAPGYTTASRPMKAKVPSFFEQAYGLDSKKLAKERPQSWKSGYARRANILDKIKCYKAPNPYKNYTNYRSTVYDDNASTLSKASKRSKCSRKNKIIECKKRGLEDEFKRFNENVSVTSKQVSQSRKSKISKY